MPTNRLRIRRVSQGNDEVTREALSYFWWAGTIPNAWADARTPEEIRVFWRKHKATITAWYIERNRSRHGPPGKRPQEFWDDVATEGHRRRRTGTREYVGPVRADGGDRTIREAAYETDLQFLKRLGGYLEPWELAAGDPSHGEGQYV